MAKHTELEYYIDRANELIEKYQNLRRDQKKMDEVVRLKWSLPPGMPDWARPSRLAQFEFGEVHTHPNRPIVLDLLVRELCPSDLERDLGLQVQKLVPFELNLARLQIFVVKTGYSGFVVMFWPGGGAGIRSFKRNWRFDLPVFSGLWQTLQKVLRTPWCADDHEPALGSSGVFDDSLKPRHHPFKLGGGFGVFFVMEIICEHGESHTRP